MSEDGSSQLLCESYESEPIKFIPAYDFLSVSTKAVKSSRIQPFLGLHDPLSANFIAKSFAIDLLICRYTLVRKGIYLEFKVT